jgi:hypothetical protein
MWNVNYIPDMENLLVYFDHELADSRYVPTLTIAKAPVVDVENNEIRFHPLIRGCHYVKHTINGVPVHDIPAGYFLHFDEETKCPPTYYKRIRYTLLRHRIRTFYDIGDLDPESSPEDSSEFSEDEPFEEEEDDTKFFDDRVN